MVRYKKYRYNTRKLVSGRQRNVMWKREISFSVANMLTDICCGVRRRCRVFGRLPIVNLLPYNIVSDGENVKWNSTNDNIIQFVRMRITYYSSVINDHTLEHRLMCNTLTKPER